MANYLVPYKAGGAAEGNLLGLPYGFRFHPTDEEIVIHYLIPKVMNSEFSAVAIGQVDFKKCEPWDLPRFELKNVFGVEIANLGEKEERYYYCQRDKKYPTGVRTNRASRAGYWKATGKDREIFTRVGDRKDLIGMKKTLVFYKGRAPRGEKTNWVMHEFRLLHYPQISLIPQDDGWVVSRVFHKNGGGGGGSGVMVPKNTYTSVESSYSQIQRSDDSFSTDDLMNDDEFESLPPLVDPCPVAPIPHQLMEFKPKKVSFSPMISSNGLFPNQPVNMQQPQQQPSAHVFNGYEEDQLIYDAADPSYYYPTFYEEPLFHVPYHHSHELELVPFKVENDLVLDSMMDPEFNNFYQHNVDHLRAPSAQIGVNNMINNNNDLEMMAAVNEQEYFNELVPSTIGSMAGMSNRWGF